MQLTKNYFNTIQSNITEITAPELNEKLQKQSDVVLIDVREDAEWQQGAIPTAIHVSKGYLECQIENTVPDPNKEIILYCRRGNRSAIAADSLQRMGYKNVKSLQGGISAWQESFATGKSI